MDCLGEEDAVDPARAGAGDDVSHNPQAQAVLLAQLFKQLEIDSFGPRRAGIVSQESPARAA